MVMIRLVILSVLGLYATSASAVEVRVRLAKSANKMSLKGTVNCGKKRFDSPSFSWSGNRLMVAGQSVDSTRCSGRGRYTYSGTTWSGGVEVQPHGEKLILIGLIDIEAYVAGVVSAELLPGWPMESLKAMAVAARSYTLWRMGRSNKLPFHLTADVSSQVFRGMARLPKPVLQATKATEGQILRYNNKPIAAYYHACAAGRTASASEVWGRGEPYLKSVISPDLACNRINWRSAMHVNEAGKKLGVGSLSRIKIIGFTESNRVEEVEVVGTSGRRIFSGQDLRKRLGWAVLRSTDFSPSVQGRQLVFVGHGSGHGVGMSQWGAKGLAQRGKSYRLILQHFYPGTDLR